MNLKKTSIVLASACAIAWGTSYWLSRKSNTATHINSKEQKKINTIFEKNTKKIKTPEIKVASMCSGSNR